MLLHRGTSFGALKKVHGIKEVEWPEKTGHRYHGGRMNNLREVRKPIAHSRRVNMLQGETIILVVEDNPGDARLLRIALEKVPEFRFHMVHVKNLGEVELLPAERGFDVVLLDLELPDGYGLDTLARIREIAPTLPVIVLTGMQESAVAQRALRMGAQDFFTKGEYSSGMLVHAIRYAIERQAMITELASIRQRARIERELHFLHYLKDNPPQRITERTLGFRSLRESLPEKFLELSKDYDTLMDFAVNNRGTSDVGVLSGRLAMFATDLAAVSVSVPDVIQLHTNTLRMKTVGMSPMEANLYVEEGHRVILELMANLVACYRTNTSEANWFAAKQGGLGA
ncbi:MAG: response regulator [Ignavibacteria bacterium]|nr:response regulator [Ignavibacteria bacterium]